MEDGLVWDSVDHKYVYRDSYDGPMGIFEGFGEFNVCDLCGEDYCICDRIAAEQNADYESQVY